MEGGGGGGGLVTKVVVSKEKVNLVLGRGACGGGWTSDKSRL